MNFYMCYYLATLKLFIHQHVFTTTQTILTNNCCACLIYRIYMCIFIYYECYITTSTTNIEQIRFGA